MEKAERYAEDSSYVVPVAGHSEPLYFEPGIHRCGEIHNGVAFEFGRGGSWVIDLDTLRAMVDMAEEERARRAAIVHTEHSNPVKLTF
jgi:hypothetical protein